MPDNRATRATSRAPIGLRLKHRYAHRIAAPWWLTGYVVGTGGPAALTALLLPVRSHLALTSIGFLFLAAVAVIAAGWGRGPGLMASIVANVCLNWFFVPPRHHYTVQDPSDAIALVVFLLVAVLTSTLLARARAGEAAARRHVDELSILYDLARLTAAEVDLPAALTGLCERTSQVFGVRSCSIWLTSGETFICAAYAGEPPDPALTQDELHCARDAVERASITMLGGSPSRRNPRIVGQAGRAAPVSFVPMRAGGRVIGLTRLAGRLQSRIDAQDDARLLAVLADEAAAAVERDRLGHEAARAGALTAADQLKSALLSAVSHDLRSPLAAIKASVSSLLEVDVPWDPATVREFLLAIDEETDRLTRLVSNLLDMSRIEGGALHPVIDRYDAGELLETAVARLSRTVPRHHLVLDIAPGTGDAPLDYVQISQVITNLVENAAKFAPPDTTITITARRLADLVEIAVNDEGPGIPAAERERVFDAFYRTSGAARRPGTGLGLAISKGLIEAHGGTMFVEQATGGGARVVVRLPAPAPAASLPPAPAYQPRSDRWRPRRRSATGEPGGRGQD